MYVLNTVVLYILYLSLSVLLFLINVYIYSVDVKLLKWSPKRCDAESNRKV